MSDFILSATSTVDIDQTILQNEDIRWVAYNYEIDGKLYKEDFGKTIALNDFYEKMKAGSMTRTSQITYASYLEYFENLLEEEKDILHLCLSSGITGSYNQALMAKEKLEEKYSVRKIYIVDSLTATACQGHLLLAMNKLKKEGKSIDEVYQWALENRAYVNGWFFTSDLTYLVRGGRISKAAGSFANFLNVCPMIEVDGKGELIVREKIRTKKKAINSLVTRIKNQILEREFCINDIFIVHTHSLNDAKDLEKLLLENLPDFKGRIIIYEIGTTIGAHLGPGTLGATFWGKKKSI